MESFGRVKNSQTKLCLVYFRNFECIKCFDIHYANCYLFVIVFFIWSVLEYCSVSAVAVINYLAFSIWFRMAWSFVLKYLDLKCSNIQYCCTHLESHQQFLIFLYFIFLSEIITFPFNCFFILLYNFFDWFLKISSIFKLPLHFIYRNLFLDWEKFVYSKLNCYFIFIQLNYFNLQSTDLNLMYSLFLKLILFLFVS